MTHTSNSDTNIAMFTTESNVNFVWVECSCIYGCCSTNYAQFTFTKMVSTCLAYFSCFLVKQKNAIPTCAQIGKTLTISYVHTDFEIAVHETATYFWPQITNKACQFYLSQAWWWKAFSLRNAYRDNDSVVGKWLNKFWILIFLKSEVLKNDLSATLLKRYMILSIPVNSRIIFWSIDETAKFPPMI